MNAGGWEDLGIEGGYRIHRKGEDHIVSMADLHIYKDNVDAEIRDLGIDFDAVVFMSKHSAASGEPALTVHPIGNYHGNDYGGREKTLVKPCPSMMTDALRHIVSYCDMQDFQTCFEVTHHGPWLDSPTFFIEIGSDDRNWGNMHAAEILSNVITEMDYNDYPNVVGIAGGHYAPRFTDMAISYKVNLGHMIPNYHLEGRSDDDILRMVKDATDSTGTKMVYFHRNALKKQFQRHILDLVGSDGYEVVRSSDFDPINENLQTCH